MHLNDARKFNLLAYIEQTLSEQNLLKDLFLASRIIMFGGLIPVDELVNHKDFRPLNLRRDDICRAVSTSRRVQLFESPEQGIPSSLYPGFTINGQVLVCPNVDSVNEFKQFIEKICGNTKDILLSLEKKNDNCTITFKETVQCFAFWRALQWVPYKGKFITPNMTIFVEPQKSNIQRNKNKSRQKSAPQSPQRTKTNNRKNQNTKRNNSKNYHHNFNNNNETNKPTYKLDDDNFPSLSKISK